MSSQPLFVYKSCQILWTALPCTLYHILLCVKKTCWTRVVWWDQANLPCPTDSTSSRLQELTIKCLGTSCCRDLRTLMVPETSSGMCSLQVVKVLNIVTVYIIIPVTWCVYIAHSHIIGISFSGPSEKFCCHDTKHNQTKCNHRHHSNDDYHTVIQSWRILWLWKIELTQDT